MVKNKLVVWFEQVDKHDVGLVGGKGANLGEMTNARLPIPYGFIITSHAYFDFMHKENLMPKIRDISSMLNYENPHELQQASKHIQSLIMSRPMPKHIANEIIEYYESLFEKEKAYFKLRMSILAKGFNRLKHLYKQPLVAVRSSATAEDLPTASFAGQQETFLNVRGESHILAKVKECWASLFTERAMYYRHEQGFDRAKVGLAAVIQRMVESGKSGIAFSIDPVTNDKTKIVIEAIFGLGEYIVQGKVTPDHYEVSKNSFILLSKEVSHQPIKMVKSGISNREVKIGRKEGSKQKLSPEEITKVAMLVKEIEDHYYFPQDIEWAIEDGTVYIVQSRPITTISKNQESITKDTKTQSNEPLVQVTPIVIGSPASPGIATGPVIVIFSPSEIEKVKKGDILVAPQTNPDYVPAMKKAAAIVTDKGGRTSHAAIVSRELGVPAVVGTENATKKLKNDMIVTVNGEAGEVYKGDLKVSSNKKSGGVKSESNAHTHAKKYKTLTKVYVNLAEPEHAKKVAEMDVDGVGLLRAEFMIAEIGVHPKIFIKQKKEYVFVNRLTRDLLTFAKAFSPRPIIYRATDFKTNEYSHLTGGKAYEPHEENPMIGFRGASRYIANPDVFIMELRAIQNVWLHGFHNLHLMIPFVRVPWELIKIKEMIKQSGLLDLPGFKLLIMVEVPSCALYLDEFLKIGVDGVSIGTNDLTMMLLGVDRDNEEVANIYDERNPFVVKVLEHIVKTCSEYNVTSSICGQAASDYPEIVEKLVRYGITSVSVNPDAIGRTRENIYTIEKKHFDSLRRG